MTVNASTVPAEVRTNETDAPRPTNWPAELSYPLTAQSVLDNGAAVLGWSVAAKLHNELSIAEKQAELTVSLS